MDGRNEKVTQRWVSHLKNNSILKTQQSFKSERYHVFTEEFNKIALSSNDDKRMQPVYLIGTYAYGTSKNLVSEKGEIECKNIIKRYKMINFDVIRKETKEHTPNWPQIPDHPYRILIIRCSGSGKTNSLFNIISQQPHIDKIYSYANKDPYKAKYTFLINKRESTSSKDLSDSKAFIEYSNNMDKLIKTLKNATHIKNKISIVFDMIADVLGNKKLNSIVTELFN